MSRGAKSKTLIFCYVTNLNDQNASRKERSTGTQIMNLGENYVAFIISFIYLLF